jgi:hypothetical protein
LDAKLYEGQAQVPDRIFTVKAAPLEAERKHYDRTDRLERGKRVADFVSRVHEAYLGTFE